MSGFGILSRKEYCASTEVDVLYLDPDEFAHATAELINDLEHQLVPVIVNAVEKTLQFIGRQIADDLAKAFIPLGGFLLLVADGDNRIVAVFDFHANVKSRRFINLRCH